MERAKKQLGIRARKNGTTWAWELPTPTPNTPPVGLDGVVGLQVVKADKDDNPDSDTGLVTDFDPDAEIARVREKFGDDGEGPTA